MSNVLFFAEHSQGSLRKLNGPALTAARQLATRVGGQLIALVVGEDVGAVAQAVARLGVDKVVCVDDAALRDYLPRRYASVVAEVAEDEDAEVVLAAVTTLSKDLLPRVAVRLEAAMISDVVDFLDEDDAPAFVRPMWASKLFEVVTAATDVVCLTVRHTAFAAQEESGRVAPIAAASPEIVDDGTTFERFDAVESARPALTDADVVVAGGRGLGSAEGFASLEPLADLFNAAIGATRAAVDAGYCPNDWQIGQTGKIVAPDLYFAVGISGAIQHVAGMKNAKTIVAINKNPEEPIFQLASYAVVGDAHKLLPQLVEALTKAKA